MSSVCGVVRPSVVFLQIEDAVCQGHLRRTYSSLWGTVERSRTDSGAPTRWAYTRCAEAHQASGDPREVAVTGPSQTSGCRWRLQQRRSSPVVACRAWPSESRPVLHCSSRCGTSRRRGQVFAEITRRLRDRGSSDISVFMCSSTIIRQQDPLTGVFWNTLQSASKCYCVVLLS